MNKTIDQKLCKKTIAQGAVLRVVVTFIAFYFIKKWIGTNSKYLFIILPIALSILDSVDSIPNLIKSQISGSSTKICHQLFAYQSTDKVNDLISYVLAWYWFDLDPLFLVFCGLRAFGLLGFLTMKKSYPLMIFPDLMKEYLLYRFLIPKGFSWLPAVIVTKICFEIYFHTRVNPSSY